MPWERNIGIDYLLKGGDVIKCLFERDAVSVDVYIFWYRVSYYIESVSQIG